MRYLALLTNPSEEWERWRALSPDEAAALRAEEMPRWNAFFAAAGARIVDGRELGDPAEAKVVRVREGETTVTDGPYAETKEVLGGYLVLECDDLDDALALAVQVPVAHRGSVELRPLQEQ